MKLLILTAAFTLFTSNLFAADSTTPNVIKAEMTLFDASRILAQFGITYSERFYDIANREGSGIKYFPLDDNVDLVVFYATGTGRIASLTLMTSPTYKPVKGLEVNIPLLSLQFEKDGSYIAHLMRLQSEKDGKTPKSK